MINNIFKKKKRGFTLAEILVTLSIIGIVAAILFPSILANYTERTLSAKRQALIARMSQAMGELGDAFSNYEDANNPAQDSALKFINEGLSKAYKIVAACDYATLKSCDIPETVTMLDSTTFNLIDKSATFFTYSPFALVENSSYDPEQYSWKFDTEPAAFMTKNGESILLFFNPRCKGKGQGTGGYNTSNYITAACINMIYDLNGGKQKPNRINEDIGFMTVFYSDTPYVVSPKITPNTAYGATSNTNTESAAYGAILASYPDAKAACSALGENVKIPSYEEMGSVAINSALYMDNKIYESLGTASTFYFWTSTVHFSGDGVYNKIIEIDPRSDQIANIGNGHLTNNAKYHYVCIYDN